MLEIKKTERNFPLVEFKDFYKKSCTLQLSSIFYPRCVWLGRDECRMHLSVDQVKELLPLLQKFVEDGDFNDE